MILFSCCIVERFVVWVKTGCFSLLHKNNLVWIWEGKVVFSNFLTFDNRWLSKLKWPDLQHSVVLPFGTVEYCAFGCFQRGQSQWSNQIKAGLVLALGFLRGKGIYSSPYTFLFSEFRGVKHFEIPSDDVIQGYKFTIYHTYPHITVCMNIS